MSIYDITVKEISFQTQGHFLDSWALYLLSTREHTLHNPEFQSLPLPIFYHSGQLSP